MKPFFILVLCQVISFPACSMEWVRTSNLQGEDIIIDKNYKGKLHDDKRTKLLIQVVEKDIETAIKQIKDLTGLEPKQGCKIHVRFSDYSPVENARASTASSGGDAVITFSVPNMLRDGGEREFIETFRHELTHAVVRTHIKDEKIYDGFPIWVRESFCVLVGGEKYRWSHVALIKTNGALTNKLDGLDSGGFASWDMLESYLALEYIIKSQGEEKLRKLALDIFVLHKDFKEAIRSATGKKYDEFVLDAFEYSREYAKKIQGNKKFDESDGEWKSELSKEFELEIYQLTDRVEIKEVDPETFRIWVVNKEGWIFGDVPVVVSNLEKQGSKFSATLKIDLTRLKGKSGAYYIWYMIHDKHDNLKRMRISFKINLN